VLSTITLSLSSRFAKQLYSQSDDFTTGVVGLVATQRKNPVTKAPKTLRVINPNM
jgi:hypothetical protein